MAAQLKSDPTNLDKQDVRDIFEAFVSRKASNDTTIEDHSSVLSSCIEEQAGEKEFTRCTEVGEALADIADEIDLAHGESIQDLMRRVGAPNEAFGTFQSVASTLFSWDTGGRIGKPIVKSRKLNHEVVIPVVRVTWYKIAALLGFCYNLWRQFLFTADNQRSLKAFFTAVVGYLTRFLFEGQLMNWIRSQGGWVSYIVFNLTCNLCTILLIGEYSSTTHTSFELDNGSWNWTNCRSRCISICI